MADAVSRSEAVDKRLLDYLMSCYTSWKGWWGQDLAGSPGMSRHDFFQTCRKRYTGRRSVASLDSDVKDKPFPRSSNFGIGAEQIFGEFLIPTLLANTRDLEPRLQVVDRDTDEVDQPRTIFHDTYHKRLASRALAEHSTREVLTVGSAYHKWSYETLWRQTEAKVVVWVSPTTGQPMMQYDSQLGQSMPVLADPSMPKELWPRDPISGQPFTPQSLPDVKWNLVREGPNYSVRTLEAILFPPSATEPDPQKWQEGLMDTFEVSPFWFVGREGDPWEGKLKNLNRLWQHLGVDPNKLYKQPAEFTKLKVKVVEFHLPYPVMASGKPVEIMGLFLPEVPVLLGWRVSIFPRRPLFNRQLWHRGDVPIGKGIPETIWGFRDALDASVNQDTDSGNLWNHPPVLISDLAMLDDEEYEMQGPGTRWVVRDINGVRTAFTPPATRNPMERENWLFGMAQRIWGVTDLNMNAPTSSLSPNVDTATGVVSILNQGSIKFGHLTKRLAETDSLEYQFVHETFGRMLANPITVPNEGQALTIEPIKREEFFDARYQVLAVGNGITTNPTLRQQMLGQVITLSAKHPIAGADLELQQEMFQDLLAAMGLKYKLKTPQAVEQMKIFLELMKTPEGQQLIPQAMQQAIQMLQGRMAQGNGAPAPGRANVAMA